MGKNTNYKCANPSPTGHVAVFRPATWGLMNLTSSTVLGGFSWHYLKAAEISSSIRGMLLLTCISQEKNLEGIKYAMGHSEDCNQWDQWWRHSDKTPTCDTNLIFLMCGLREGGHDRSLLLWGNSKHVQSVEVLHHRFRGVLVSTGQPDGGGWNELPAAVTWSHSQTSVHIQLHLQVSPAFVHSDTHSQISMLH